MSEAIAAEPFSREALSEARVVDDTSTHSASGRCSSIHILHWARACGWEYIFFMPDIPLVWVVNGIANNLLKLIGVSVFSGKSRLTSAAGAQDLYPVASALVL